MPAPRKANKRTPNRAAPDMRPLQCSQCLGHDLHVERGQNSRRRNGKRRAAVNVVCDRCGHEWWSVARVAVALAKAADAEARG